MQHIHLALDLIFTQVASLAIGFGPTLSDAVYHYHSVFDSERWMEIYGDPGFVRHVRDPSYRLELFVKAAAF